MWRNTHFTTRPGVLCGTCRMTTYPECPPSTLLALPTVFLWHMIWGELVLWMSLRKKAQRGMVHSLGLSQSTHLLGTIKAHEESEVLGLVGGKSCPSYAVSSTTHYSLWMCQCRAVLSKRTFCKDRIFLFCTFDVVMVTGTMWLLSLWTMASVPKVMNFFNVSLWHRWTWMKVPVEARRGHEILWSWS